MQQDISRDAELGEALIALATEFTLLGEEIARTGRVTPQQWAIMYQVRTAGQAGASPSGLAAMSRTSRANITKLISRLEEAGYLVIHPSPIDGRWKRVWLTKAGKRVLERMNAKKQERLVRLMASFTDGEKATLRDLAQRLLVQLRSA